MISAWSAISPFGLDAVAFAEGVQGGRRPADCAVPGFDTREVLGRKGTRTMDRVTALAVATAKPLVEGLGDETALVLGTNVSSVKSSMDFARDTLTEEKPFYVDAGRFPNAVLNCAAAQCAIWHTLKGPNATVSGGRATGLLALNYARRLHRSGRATGAVLCGATEELTEERSWLELKDASSPLSEGCAMFLLERDGPGQAEVLAVEFGVCSDLTQAGGVLRRCVDRAFASSDAEPESLWLIVGSGGEGEDLDGIPAKRLCVTDLVGDTFAASSAFGIATVLALAEAERRDGTALVTAVDRDGVVGCALLRLTGEGTR
ncbi:beta-ketoacyl synthase N-terminal-like domain-containing protein [Actinomadura rudentiformis]|uniref:3-oxoacyl-ACP synthase n=1 Tax=Actinomadura rudentiformis TaxID=359158 RepID=A0A6H9YA73_9ACTN|nr:beta-ketoacyl synthase N-terminal-like domain-containing protein [Actinomadura rudentiformis]KAB2339697.1 3-oxoacyl-ACP synthase [Actinomadura rudentiformis]